MATAPKELEFKAEIADAFRRSGARLKDIYGLLAHLCYIRGWEAPLPMSVSQWVNGKYEPTGRNAFLMVEVLNTKLEEAGQKPMSYGVSWAPPVPPRRGSAKKQPTRRGSTKRGTNFLYSELPSDQVKRAA